MENEKIPTQEEMVRLEESRVLSDAELIKGGAKIEVGENGNRTNLFPTKEQIEKIGLEMRKNFREGERESVDLGAYIKLHKEIILPSQEIKDDELREKIQREKGRIQLVRVIPSHTLEGIYDFKCDLFYVDKEGNVAYVDEIRSGNVPRLVEMVESINNPKFNPDLHEELGLKVTDSKEYREEKLEKQKNLEKRLEGIAGRVGDTLKECLKEIGFSGEMLDKEDSKKIEKAYYDYRVRIKEAEKIKKKVEFDF